MTMGNLEVKVKSKLLAAAVAVVSLGSWAESIEPTDLTTLATKYWRGVSGSASTKAGAGVVFDGQTTAGVYWRGVKPNPSGGVVPFVEVSFFTNSLVVNAYAITEIPTSSGRQPGCAPKHWKLFGAKSPTSEWVLLDERMDVTDWKSSGTASDTKTFTFANTVAYSCYLIEFHANCGNDYIELAEFALLHAGNTRAFEVQSNILAEPNSEKVPYEGFLRSDGESIGFDLDSTVYIDPQSSARYDLAGWTLTDYAGNVLRSGEGNEGLHPFSHVADGTYARLTLNWIDQRFNADWSSLTDITVPANAAKNAITGTAYYYKGPGSEIFNDNKTDNGLRVYADAADNFVTYEFKTGREIVTGLRFMPYDTPDGRYWLEGSQTGDDGEWTEITAADFQSGGFGQPSSFNQPIFFDNDVAYPFYRLHLTVKTSKAGLREVEFYSRKTADMLEVFGAPNAYGTPEPLYGITTGHAPGELVSCAAPALTIDVMDGVRSACVGGIVKADGTVVTNLTKSFTFDFSGKYTSLTWLWADEFEQKVSAQGAGAVDVAGGSVWVASGEEVTFTAQADEGAVFAYWSGDVPDGEEKSNPLTYRADGPRQLTAVFTSPTYVSPSGNDENDGLSWETALASPVVALERGAIKVYLAAGDYVVPGDAILLANGETFAGVGAPEQTTVRVDPEHPGAVLRVTSGEALVRNLTVEGGQSSDGFAAGLVLEAGMATNVIVRNNHATASGSLGGGVYLGEGTVFADSVVSNNTTAGNGGGVHFAGVARFENCLVANNTAVRGGGVAGSSVGGCFVSGLELSGNVASDLGGGASFGVDVTVSNCWAAGNSCAGSGSEGGGGFHFAGSGSSWLVNSTATNNTSRGSGGGVSVQTGSINMHDCVLSGNLVTQDRGGGLELYGAAKSLIERCVFSANSCSSSGGGILADGATFRNCLIAGNSAGGDGSGNGGGGVFIHQGDCVFENCTITKNVCSTGSGSGITLRANSVTLRNCIVWGNDNTITTDVDFQGSFANSCIGGYSGAVTSVIAENPKLTKDFHLKPSSPCINTGANLSYTLESLDLDCQPRIHDFDNPKRNICDMGCYESSYFGPCGLVISIR